MAVIYTKRGHEITVDDHNYEWLKDKPWYVDTRGYVVRGHVDRCKGKFEFLHRAVLAKKLGREILPYPKEIVDHRDLDPLNNCEDNLRPATLVTNNFNSKKFKRVCSSIYKGVTYMRTRAQYPSPWVGRIVIDGKRRVKAFSTELEAALWYDEQAFKHCPEYARLNFPKQAVS